MLARLPDKISVLAEHAIENPELPQYLFKKLANGPRLKKSSVAVRVTSQGYRAIGQRLTNGEIWWYWVGTHEAYNGMVGK